MYEETICSAPPSAPAGMSTTRWTIPVAISRGLGSRSIMSSAVLTVSCRCAKSSLRVLQPACRRRSLTPRHKLRPYAHSATSTSAVSMLRLTPTPTTGLRWVSPSSRVSPTMRLRQVARPSRSAMTSSSRTSRRLSPAMPLRIPAMATSASLQLRHFWLACTSTRETPRAIRRRSA